MTTHGGGFAALQSPDRNNLTALRLLAAFCVLASHCALLRSGQDSAEPLAGLTAFNLGDHALNAFFFISGLTVAASYDRARSLVDFVVARGLRLWPALVVVTLVTTLVAAPLLVEGSAWAYFRNPAWLGMIAKTALLAGAPDSLPGLFAGNPLPHVVNGSPWTLKFEAICYAGLAAGSLIASGRARALWLPATILISAGLMVQHAPLDPATALDHLARFWVAFGLGAAIYRSPALGAFCARHAVALLALTSFALIALRGGRFEEVTAEVCIGAAIFVLATWPLGALRRLTNRIDLSYGVYLTAWPITQILMAKTPALSAATLFAIVALCSTAWAWLSWTLIEQPALRRRRPLVTVLERASVALLERARAALGTQRGARLRKRDPVLTAASFND